MIGAVAVVAIAVGAYMFMQTERAEPSAATAAAGQPAATPADAVPAPAAATEPPHGSRCGARTPSTEDLSTARIARLSAWPITGSDYGGLHVRRGAPGSAHLRALFLRVRAQRTSRQRGLLRQVAGGQRRRLAVGAPRHGVQRLRRRGHAGQADVRVWRVGPGHSGRGRAEMGGSGQPDAHAHADAASRQSRISSWNDARRRSPASSR